MSQIRSIQILRALAAFLVAFGHIEHEAMSLPSAAGGRYSPLLLDLTGAGVDLFFVISGFIMVYASRDLFARPGAVRTFLTRRFARIVPLYWIMTSLFLVVMVGGHVLSSEMPTLKQVVMSYLFLPYAAVPGEAMQPVYKLGWTLNYEMFFYLVFAATLMLPRRRATLMLVVALGGFCALGAWVSPSAGSLAFWTHPIVLEFVMGALVATAYLEGVAWGPRAAVAAIAAGLAGFAVSVILGLDEHGAARPLVWGLPAALILAGAVFVSTKGQTGAWMRALVLLGDASYAAYLLHPMIVRGLRMVWNHVPLTANLSPWVYVAVASALVMPLAVLLHLAVERPLTRWLGRPAKVAAFRSPNRALANSSQPI